MDYQFTMSARRHSRNDLEPNQKFVYFPKHFPRLVRELTVSLCVYQTRDKHEACIYVCMYICMYVCMYACMYVFMYVCMYCMYVCMYCMYVCIHSQLSSGCPSLTPLLQRAKQYNDQVGRLADLFDLVHVQRFIYKDEGERKRAMNALLSW